jgi:leader peptidase (prepilin peptidase)/N-methyltransferase
MSTSWTTVAVSAALAVAVSPLLAGWSDALANGDTGGWWRPRKVDTARLIIVAAAALTFGALAGGGGPWPAWWLLAAGGTVLAVVDAQRNLLPARLVYPLAVIEAAVLVVASITTHDAAALSRAGLAALIVGTAWFLLAFAAGGGVGLGDVRVATLTAGLLGWLGWTTVMRAQLVTVLLIVVTAAVVAVARPDLRGRKMPVPLGPSLVLASLLMCWI